MRSSVLLKLVSRRGTLSHEITLGLIALVLGAAVFYVDAFTEIQSAIAVLYVIVLLLAAEVLTRIGTTLLAIICAALTLFAYFYSHGLGEDVPAQLRFAVSLAAITITCALILRNETARVGLIEANLHLRDSETRYRYIFEHSRIALWERDYSAVRTFLMSLKSEGVTDLREYYRTNPGIIATCTGLIRTIASNDAALELLGHVADGPSSRNMRRYIAPDDDTFLDLMNAIFRGERHFEGKGNLIAENGETRLVIMSMSFPEDPAAFNRVVVGMVDITQREMMQKAIREAQDELARASRAATVGTLSASLAHELNQPLGAIVVNAQTLLRWLNREPPDLDAVRRSAERIIRDSQRASEIIHNTRSMLTQTDRTPEYVDLEALIEETRTLMEHDFQRDMVTFEVASAEMQPAVKAIRIELQQVLINLVTNAIQAMRETAIDQRKILISLARKDDMFVTLSVRDFGPGISEEAMTKLFTPFFTTKPAGMGMGLSICRSTLEARGGQLTAGNHPEGGAIFEMIIPIEDDYDRH
ncbi:PAS domain S-box-containing protein [Rhizobium sp. BK650]|uniref:sensor histidine kinase n=1 Tax=Rhizobium sp. BK650 TaxID=2586990 RepID=UPI00160D8ED8|nr:ATP-binding protein [Rhizobium sp. BK650]MBB3654877.1 PAS domain S-box-containing protein [Rhizobium sp. BK650]